MKALIVGGGGREHALAWAISKSDKVDTIFAAPGNGGTAACGENISIDAEDIDELAAYAKTHAVDLTVVGPEGPLVAGIVDRFESLGLLCFGPSQSAARLEGSKVFAKEFMKRHGIPTADFEVFRDAEGARSILSMGGNAVISADVSPTAVAILQADGMDVYGGAKGTVAQAIEQYKLDQLRPLGRAKANAHWS